MIAIAVDTKGIIWKWKSKGHLRQLSALASLKVRNLRVREPLSRMIKLTEESWTSPSVRLTIGQK